MGGCRAGGAHDTTPWFWRAEAERLAADNVVLQARVVELEGQVGVLTEKVSVLARMAFGTLVGRFVAFPRVALVYVPARCSAMSWR